MKLFQALLLILAAETQAKETFESWCGIENPFDRDCKTTTTTTTSTKKSSSRRSRRNLKSGRRKLNPVESCKSTTSTSKKTSSSSSSTSSSQEACSDTVVCGGTYYGAVTLERAFGCPIVDASGEFAITMDGPDAVLDCQDNAVFRPRVLNVDFPVTVPIVEGTKGIILKNGATAHNCIVKGFEVGFSVEGGDVAIYNSMAFFNEDGVRSAEDTTGNLLIMDSMFFSNTDDGAELNADGTVQMHNVRLYGNREEGIIGKRGNFCFFGENLDFLSNGCDSFQINAEGASFRENKVYLAGNNKIIDDGEDGTQFDNALNRFEFFLEGSLEVAYVEEDGVQFLGQATIGEDAFLYSCNNGEEPEDQDIDLFISLVGPTSFTNLGEENVVCNTLDDTAVELGVVCTEACDDINTVTACVEKSFPYRGEWW